MNARKLLLGYVDETGDRGIKAQSSPYFGLAGVIVPEEDDPLVHQAMNNCRTKINVPRVKAFHWSEHARSYSRRQMITSELLQLTTLRVNYVLFQKAAIPATSTLYGNHAKFYNFAAGVMMERMLHAARNWPDGPRDIAVKFAHVRGFDHTDTLTYFAIKQARSRGTRRAPWHLHRGNVKFKAIGDYDGLQAADQYAGMLKAAISPDEFGQFEEHHFMRIREQIRRRPDGRCWGAGFKAFALPGGLEALPWWPAEGL
ncbi:DUF3800 domain-containing protein [Catellatospora methionotrophica]|uniref:DUF3800 domain-containing protein n=1 Tax=Catellatospora methionotrophica TaxID=121620 RepID=UPI00140BCF21|nr:DUF3800 domain-containing protein [Catellatospora methionotrophica]